MYFDERTLDDLRATRPGIAYATPQQESDAAYAFEHFRDSAHAKENSMKEGVADFVARINKENGTDLKNPYEDGLFGDVKRDVSMIDEFGVDADKGIDVNMRINEFNERLAQLAAENPDNPVFATNIEQIGKDYARTKIEEAKRIQENSTGDLGTMWHSIGGTLGSQITDPTEIGIAILGGGVEWGGWKAAQLAAYAGKQAAIGAGGRAVALGFSSQHAKDIGAERSSSEALNMMAAEGLGAVFIDAGGRLVFGAAKKGWKAIRGATAEEQAREIVKATKNAKPGTAEYKLFQGKTEMERAEGLEEIAKRAGNDALVEEAQEIKERAAIKSKVSPEKVDHSPLEEETGLAQGIRASNDPEEPVPGPALPPTKQATDPKIASGHDLPETFKLRDKPAHVEMINPTSMKSAPNQLQFRSGTGAAGYDRRMAKTTEWNEQGSGRMVALERLDGEFYVVDGMARWGAANRMMSEGKKITDVETIVLREKDGWTPEEARLVGAQKNAQENMNTGRANGKDVIDFARMIRQHPDDFLDTNMPMGTDAFQLAQLLAKLSDDAFAMVEAKKVPPGRAAKVARHVDDPEQHAKVMQSLQDNATNLVNEGQVRKHIEKMRREHVAARDAGPKLPNTERVLPEDNKQAVQQIVDDNPQVFESENPADFIANEKKAEAAAASKTAASDKVKTEARKPQTELEKYTELGESLKKSASKLRGKGYDPSAYTEAAESYRAIKIIEECS